ncbi:hypothetical protein JCM1840_006845 [Sporobolomyces johnsonii]
MSRATFRQIVALLSRDPNHLDDPNSRNPFLFNTSGTGRPAQAVDVQLGTFLRFVAKLTHISSARDTAVGEGSAYNYRRNIIGALLALQPRFLRLPLTKEEKKEVSDGFGVQGCLGAIDGSLFKLKNKPKDSGMAYYCRKKFYGINLIAACFKTTPWTMRPFDNTDLRSLDAATRDRRTAFNENHASLRICIEHAFGRLQARFPIVTELPGDNLNDIWRLVCSLLVLHNIIERFNDDGRSSEGCTSDEEEEEEAEEVRARGITALFARDGEVDAERRAVRECLIASALAMGSQTAAEMLEAGREFRLAKMDEFGTPGV